MPFVRISLLASFSQATKEAVSKAVHESLMQEFNVPKDDYFHVLEELRSDQIIYPENYLDIPHTRDVLYVQIFAASGRTPEHKARLYQAIAEKIAASSHISMDDIIIVLVENGGKENWSFGQGKIQELKHVQ